MGLLRDCENFAKVRFELCVSHLVSPTVAGSGSITGSSLVCPLLLLALVNTCYANVCRVGEFHSWKHFVKLLLQINSFYCLGKTDRKKM